MRAVCNMYGQINCICIYLINTASKICAILMLKFITLVHQPLLNNLGWFTPIKERGYNKINKREGYEDKFGKCDRPDGMKGRV